MTKLLLVLLLLLFATTAYAAEQLVLDRTVISGESITVEDRSYRLILGDNNQVLADYGTGSLFVDNGTCRNDDIARICIDNIQIDIDTRIYDIEVRAFSRAPDITITREGDGVDIPVGQKMTIDVELENDGGIAREVEYVDTFPPEIELVSRDGGVIEGQSFVWRGTLDEDEIETFSYVIKPVKHTDQSLNAILNYWDGVQTRSIFSSVLKINTVPAIETEVEVFDNELFIGEVTNATITVTNKAPETRAVDSLDFKLSDGMVVTKKPFEFEKISSGLYRWTGEIKKRNESLNTSKDFVFHIKALTEGSEFFTLSTQYTEAGEVITPVPLQETFTIKNKGIIVRTNLDDDTMESGQSKQLKIWLQNLNPYVEIRDVNIKTNTDLTYLPDFYEEIIDAGDQLRLYDRKIFMPMVQSSTGYTLEVVVDYITEYDVPHTSTFKTTARVNQIEDLTITKTFGKSTLQGGEQTTVHVDVKNPRKTDIHQVFVSDTVPEELRTIGITENILSIPSETTVRAYSYQLVAPRVGRSVVYSLGTEAQYSDVNNGIDFQQDDTYEVSESFDITVVPEPFPITVTKRITDDTVFVGEHTRIEYEFKNPSTDKVASNIRVIPRLQQEIDQVGVASIDVPSLNPGETVIIEGEELVRFTSNGSQSLLPTEVRYENAHGFEFSVNSSSPSEKVKGVDFDGPAIRLIREVPEEIGNTEDFVVTLRATNKGETAAEVIVQDNGETFSERIGAGKTQTWTYTTLLPKAGTVDMQPASATYTYSGETYHTGSNVSKIKVTDKPVLTVTRTVDRLGSSSKASLIKIKVETAQPVDNLNVTDGENIWEIGSLDGERVIGYEIDLPQGNHDLDPAEITYTYRGQSYSAETKKTTLKIEEKALLSLRKKTSTATALPGDQVGVTLVVANNIDEPMLVVVKDGEREWKTTLVGDEITEFSYDIEAEKSGTLSIATAHFTYKDQENIIQSNAVSLAVEGEAVEEEEKDINEEPQQGTIIDSFIDIIIGVLTWQPFGEGEEGE